MGLAGKKKKLFDDQYEILSIVGRGSRSVVYHARMAGGSQEEVALKVLLAPPRADVPGGAHGAPTPSLRDQLSNEALAMIGARHHYVVRLNDFQSVQELCYLSLEYAPYGDLLAYTKTKGGQLDARQADRFFRQGVDAFHFIHSVGILHRDIKPDNILVLSDEEIRISDFGIALLPGTTGGVDPAAMGTMSYLAPEVLNGAPHTTQADIYAFGVTFYELLSGRHPFEDVPPAHQLEVRKGIRHISIARPDVPVRLGDLVMSCLEFDPQTRVRSFRELLIELGGFTYDSAFQTAPAHNNDKSDKASEEVEIKASEDIEIIETPSVDTNTAIEEPYDYELSSPVIEPLPVRHEEQSWEPEPAFEAELDEDGGRSYAAPSANLSRYPLYEKGKGAPQTPLPQSEKREPEKREPEKRERKSKREPREKQPREKGEKKKVTDAPMERSLKKQKSMGKTGRRVRLLRLIVLSFLVGLATAALLYTSPEVLSKKVATFAPKASEQSFFGPVTPLTEGTTLATLPAGVYTGTVTGVIPSRTLPLTLISDGKQELTILLGIEGAAPLTISREQAPKGFRYMVGGLVLRFNPSEDTKQLGGTVENLIGREKGEWSVALRQQ